MSWLWAVPVLVTLVGLVAVIAAAGRTTEEAHRLGDQVGRLRALHPLLTDLGTAAQGLRAAPVPSWRRDTAQG